MNTLKHQALQPQSIWHNNPVLVQLLGLSPVLAVSDNAVNGLSMGIATAIVLIFSSLTVSSIRQHINHEWRFSYYLLILAAYTSLLELSMQWFYFSIYKDLGIYLPLICCNLAIVMRLEHCASKSNWQQTGKDALITAGGIILALLLISSLRELLSNGSLFANWQMLLPNQAASSANGNPEQSPQQLLGFFQYTPAAFILLGLIIATSNYVRSKTKKTIVKSEPAVTPVKRVRVTGRLQKQS